MSTFLDVDTRSLHSTAQKYIDIANEVRAIFNHVSASIDSITANDSWQGEDALEYRNTFASLKAQLDMHISELEALGPATNKAATGYEDTETANVNSMRSGLNG